MTAHEIIAKLSADGIEVIAYNGNLKVRAPKITNAQKALIADNKPALLAHLTAAPGERNCGSQAQNEPHGAAAMPMTAPLPVDSTVFKEYKLPNGDTLKLTREEFDRVVEVFRLLHQQSLKVGKKEGAA